MVYSVVLKKSVEKDLKKLPRKIIPRIISKIEELSLNPYPRDSTKIKDAERTYRVRVGDYRIIYQVDNDKKIVTVIYVRHRKDAYKNL